MIPSYRFREKTILTNINRLVHLLIELSHRKASDKNPLIEEAVGLIKNLRPLLLNLVDGKEEHLEPLIRQLVSQKLPPIWSSFGDLQSDLNNILTLALHNSQNEMQLDEDENNYDEKPTDEEPIQFEDEKPMEQESEDEKNTIENIAIENTNSYPSELEVNDQVDTANDNKQEIKETTEQNPQESKNNNFQKQLEELINVIYKGDLIKKDYCYRSIFFNYYLPERKLGIQILANSKSIKKIQSYILYKEKINLIQVYPSDLDNMYQLTKKLSSTK